MTTNSISDAEAGKALMKLTDGQLAVAVQRMIECGTPSEHAMVVVAYQNLIQIVPFFNGQKESSKKPINIDDLIDFAADFIAPKVGHGERREVIRRRSAWFLIALAVYLLTERVARSEEMSIAAANVWAALAPSGMLINELLTNNIVWTADEKEWFSHIESKEDGVEYVVNHIVPKRFRKNERLVALSVIHKFWLDPPDFSDQVIKVMGKCSD